MSIRGLKLTQEILAQEPLRPFIKAERLPGPDVKTDEEYFAFICEHSKTSHHCAGTCRMGVDEGAVVDPRLRFNGIEGLRSSTTRSCRGSFRPTPTPQRS
jgi:choline dehydrogenase